MGSTDWVVGMALITATTGLSVGFSGCASAPARQPTTVVPASEPVVERGDGGEIHKRGGKKLTAEVGPSGGTLELGNGARITIPRGAFIEPVEVTFAEGARTTAFANHDYEKPIGPTLEIAPGVELSAPLQVSVPLSALPEGFSDTDLTLGLEVPADAQRLEMAAVQTRWDYLPAQNQHGRAVAELAQLPGYRVQFLVSKAD